MKHDLLKLKGFLYEWFCMHINRAGLVPGGPGQINLMADVDVLSFIRTQSKEAKLVTSVCTGPLVLGAAGLLKGYRATTNWASLDQLAMLGAEPVSERVVRDRNRITGASVTSGIDFALKYQFRTDQLYNSYTTSGWKSGGMMLRSL